MKMSPRSIRRAAERKAAKLAREAYLAETPATANIPDPEVAAASSTPLPAAFDFTDEEDDALSLPTDQISQPFHRTEEKAFAASASGASPEPEPEPASSPISDARLAANRANSQHSTGPRTSTGKAKSSLNAIKTGLTGQTVVLPTDDAAAYQSHVDRHFTKYSPATDDEHTLVQSVADTAWRLLRIPPLEAAVYSLGHREFANEFNDEENLNTRSGLIRAKTMLHYRRDLSNLALQERRLRNHLEKDTAKLEALQQSRAEQRKMQLAWCVKYIELARQKGDTFDPADCGFDFSKDELQTYFDRTSTQFRLVHTRPCFDKFLATFRAGQKGATA